jgi:hypothetical protein
MTDGDKAAPFTDRTRVPAPAIPSPEGLPFTDRLTVADQDRYRDEYQQAAAARRAMLALQAPLWRRALAWLPNPKAPLEIWIAAAKKRNQL